MAVVDISARYVSRGCFIATVVKEAAAPRNIRVELFIVRHGGIRGQARQRRESAGLCVARLWQASMWAILKVEAVMRMFAAGSWKQEFKSSVRRRRVGAASQIQVGHQASRAELRGQTMRCLAIAMGTCSLLVTRRVRVAVSIRASFTRRLITIPTAAISFAAPGDLAGRKSRQLS